MPDFWSQIPGGFQSPASSGAIGTVGTQQGDYWAEWMRQQAQNGARTPVGFQTGNQDQARTQQQQVIQDLQRLAMGDRNSAAQQQLKNAYGAATSQQSSLGSTMRGQSAGAAQRSIQAGQQGINRGLAGDQQMLQLQEQQAAQAMLAQLLSQQQGQDISQAQGMAQGTLGSQGYDDAMRQFYLGGAQGLDYGAAERQNQLGRAQAGLQEAQNNIYSGYMNAGMNASAGALGTLGSFGGGNQQGHKGTHTDGNYGSH